MKLLSGAVLAAVLAGSLAPAAAYAGDAENKALALRFYDAMNTRSVDALDAFVAKDFVDHNPQPGMAPGLDGLKASLKPFLASSSDLKITNGPVVVSGDYVTVWDTITGTNDGEMMGQPATKKPFQFHALDLWLIKDGKLAEGWHVEDIASMMMQIGAMGGAK